MGSFALRSASAPINGIELTLCCTNRNCRRERSAGGPFFKDYKKLQQVLVIIYMLAKRWKMARMKEELGDAKHTKRITHLIDALGEMAHDALVLKFKSELGTWKWAVIDETNMRKVIEERQERKGPSPSLQVGNVARELRS